MLLETYLAKRGLHYSQFAQQIGVSGEAVRRYLKGERMPNQTVMDRIIEATRGKVTPNDLFKTKKESAPVKHDAAQLGNSFLGHTSFPRQSRGRTPAGR